MPKSTKRAKRSARTEIQTLIIEKLRFLKCSTVLKKMFCFKWFVFMFSFTTIFCCKKLDTDRRKDSIIEKLHCKKWIYNQQSNTKWYVLLLCFINIELTWIYLPGKICSQFSLPIWTLFIGKSVNPVCGEWM